jgi:hypothetical protein
VHGIGTAHPHATAGINWHLARLSDIELLLADLREHRRPRSERDRDLAGVNGFGNAQELAAGMRGHRGVCSVTFGA